MRVRLARHAIRKVGDAPGMLGCASAREAGDCQVGGAPEKMYRTALADEPGAERGKDPFGLYKDPPEAVCVLGIVRTVYVVFVERDRIDHFAGRLADRHMEAEPAHLLHEP